MIPKNLLAQAINWLTEVFLENVVLISCVIKDDDKFYLQLILEEAQIT